ncbi:MAG: hypothetical protein GXX79_12915 [Actinomycetales bacterium]|nr:hypothetical protein [Actinomycetales bacterium]
MAGNRSTRRAGAEPDDGSAAGSVGSATGSPTDPADRPVGDAARRPCLSDEAITPWEDAGWCDETDWCGRAELVSDEELYAGYLRSLESPPGLE